MDSASEPPKILGLVDEGVQQVRHLSPADLASDIAEPMTPPSPAVTRNDDPTFRSGIQSVRSDELNDVRKDLILGEHPAAGDLQRRGPPLAFVLGKEFADLLASGGGSSASTRIKDSAGK